MDHIDVVPIMKEWLVIFFVLIVALNVWARRYTSTLTTGERAELDEEVKYDTQLW